MLALANSDCAQAPDANTRGWRSNGHPFARSSRAFAPETRMTARASVRSMIEACTFSNARPKLRTTSSWPSGGVRISHSSGPSQSALNPCAAVVMLGLVGRLRPMAPSMPIPKSGTAGSPRNPICPRGGATRNVTGPRTVAVVCTSSARRSTSLAAGTCTFLVEESGFVDRDRDRVAIG